MNRHRFLTALVLLAGAFAAPATLPAAPSTTTLSVASGTLDQALDAVVVDHISTDIHFLASDELAGRDTPSDGLKIAARYIRTRLERLGFQPGAPEGYFYTYPLQQVRVDSKGSWIDLGQGEEKSRFAFGKDYFFHRRSLQDGDASGPVVFCEYGEASDFEGLDLKGRWALTWDRLPPQAMRARNRRAQDAGAIGIIVTPGEGYADSAYPERFADWTRRLETGRVSWPDEQEDDEEGRGRGREREYFPTIYVTEPVGRALLGESSPAKGAVLAAHLTERRRVDAGARLIDLENVCGFWPGSDPELSREVIIVSAHYDHVGVGSDGGIFNGADDNGSGTSGLLALAEALRAYGPMQRSVLLLWVSGEEKGLLGSRAWASNPWLPEGCRAICNINIDMIGRNAPDKLLITPTSRREEYNGLVRLAERHAPKEGFPTLGSCDAYWHRSDHAMFARHLKIPVTFLFSDVHEDYHQPTDTPDKIDFDKIRRVTRLVMRMLDGLQAPVMDLDSPSFPGD